METQENKKYKICENVYTDDSLIYIIYIDEEPIMQLDLPLNRIEKVLSDLCNKQIDWLKENLNRDYKKYEFYTKRNSPCNYNISKQSLGTVYDGYIKTVHTFKAVKVPLAAYRLY